jgi:hypothetical protein
MLRFHRVGALLFRGLRAYLSIILCASRRRHSNPPRAQQRTVSVKIRIKFVRQSRLISASRPSPLEKRSCTRLRHGASTVGPTPQPLYRRARAHLERFSGLSPKAPVSAALSFDSWRLARIGFAIPTHKESRWAKAHSSLVLREFPPIEIGEEPL